MPILVTKGGSVGRSCWMLATRYPRAASTLARNEYSVFLTVLPLLMMATGSFRDYEMKADAGYWKLPVAIISNGNIHRDRPRPRGVEQVQRFVANGPFAGG